MQVDTMEAVKRGDAYLKDQLFEFGASQYLFIYLHTCIFLCAVI